MSSCTNEVTCPGTEVSNFYLFHSSIKPLRLMHIGHRAKRKDFVAFYYYAVLQLLYMKSPKHGKRKIYCTQRFLVYSCLEYIQKALSFAFNLITDH